MLTAIDNVINAISGVLYKPYIVPLLLILAGIYFTVRLNLLQFRLFGESIRVVKEKPVNLGATSSFGALMVSTASRVGTGNIMGVSTALCLGGPGAIFWMWAALRHLWSPPWRRSIKNAMRTAAATAAPPITCRTHSASVGWA